MLEQNQQLTQTDRITSGPISKTIISLALPVAAAMFMEFALASTDYYWVGKLGPTAQDAITSSMVIMWTVYALISIVTVGITALVARYVGAKDLQKVTFYIKQGMGLAALLGLIFGIAGFSLAPTLLRFMDPGPATLALAVPYLRVFFVSSIFFVWMDTLYAVFRASGDTRTPTLVGVTSVVINMALDPVLIFGVGPIPALGVMGASVATGIAVCTSSIIITTFMLRGKLGYRVPSPFAIRPVLDAILKITRIGLPMSSQQFVFVMVYWFLIRFVHAFGESAGAAMGIGNRMESFSYLMCFGFSVAASTMVGQNLGAKKPDRAARCAWGATGITVAFTFVTSVAFIVFPHLIASVFTDDPQVLEIAIDYLIILGLSQTAMAVEIVLDGSFGGAGDTIPPMLVLIPTSLARIPLAYLLAFKFDWGINGVWWTLTFTSMAKAIILAILFKRGRWKLKEV